MIPDILAMVAFLVLTGLVFYYIFIVQKLRHNLIEASRILDSTVEVSKEFDSSVKFNTAISSLMLSLAKKVRQDKLCHVSTSDQSHYIISIRILPYNKPVK